MLLGIIAAPIMAIQKAIPAASQFFSTIDAPRISYQGLSDPDVSSREDIELEDVTFAYPTRPDVQVLKGFSARFLKGKTTALVGPSGSGKSTIVALLERWYELGPANHEDDVAASAAEQSDPERGTKQSNRGEIRIGASGISSINLKWWRSQIGLVQQEPFLFNDTIFNNVAFGLNGTRWEKSDTAKKHELVRKACEEAFADEFIRKLPDVSEIKLRMRPALTRSGVRNRSRRKRHQTQRWATATARNRPQHYSRPSDSDLGRSHQLHRRQRRENRAKGPGPSIPESNNHRDSSQTVDHSKGR
jgi:ABC-type nitrate/sulfonate/bicarbonate transport system ATPase subunit